MAGNPACQSDDGNLAVFIGTNLETGDSITFCPNCLLQFCATLVESMTGVPVPQLIELDAELGAEASEPAPEAVAAQPVEQASEAHTEAAEATVESDDTAAATK